jgi:hypothetical protein
MGNFLVKTLDMGTLYEKPGEFTNKHLDFKDVLSVSDPMKHEVKFRFYNGETEAPVFEYKDVSCVAVQDKVNAIEIKEGKNLVLFCQNSLAAEIRGTVDKVTILVPFGVEINTEANVIINRITSNDTVADPATSDESVKPPDQSIVKTDNQQPPSVQPAQTTPVPVQTPAQTQAPSRPAQSTSTSPPPPKFDPLSVCDASGYPVAKKAFEKAYGGTVDIRDMKPHQKKCHALYYWRNPAGQYNTSSRVVAFSDANNATIVEDTSGCDVLYKGVCKRGTMCSDNSASIVEGVVGGKVLEFKDEGYNCYVKYGDDSKINATEITFSRDLAKVTDVGNKDKACLSYTNQCGKPFDNGCTSTDGKNKVIRALQDNHPDDFVVPLSYKFVKGECYIKYFWINRSDETKQDTTAKKVTGTKVGDEDSARKEMGIDNRCKVADLESVKKGLEEHYGKEQNAFTRMMVPVYTISNVVVVNNRDRCAALFDWEQRINPTNKGTHAVFVDLTADGKFKAAVKMPANTPKAKLACEVFTYGTRAKCTGPPSKPEVKSFIPTRKKTTRRQFSMPKFSSFL